MKPIMIDIQINKERLKEVKAAIDELIAKAVKCEIALKSANKALDEYITNKKLDNGE